MRRPLRSVVWLSLLLGSVAHAQPEPVVLVMPTQLGGVVPDRAGWLREFDARMERAVHQGKRTTRAPGPLTATEASCRTAECMARLAESAGTSIVIGARVTADKGSPPSYKLVVDRYDTDTPGTVRQEDAECSVCTEQEAAERLEQIAERVLPAVVVVQPVAVVEQPVIVPPPPRSKRPLYLALGVTSAVGVAGIAMLGAGGRALAIDGKPTDHDTRLYDTHGTGAGLVATGVILTVGALIGIGVEAHALKKRDR